MYEVNLSKEELISYYDALMNSENTANQEEECRKLNKTFVTESSDTMEEHNDDNNSQIEMSPTMKEKKSFAPKTWSFLKKDIMPDNKTSPIDEVMEALNENKPKDATKVIFGFNDMLKSEEEDICHIVKHNLKFIPIQCTPQFLEADQKTKAKMLYAYHSKLHDIRHNLARQSLIAAPVPKATLSINHESTSAEHVDLNETYVSRSGRQTKRKIYYDENSLDDDFESVTTKKLRNKEDDWADKSSMKTDKGREVEKQPKYDKIPIASENLVKKLDDDKKDNEDKKVSDKAPDKSKNKGNIFPNNFKSKNEGNIFPNNFDIF